MRRRIALEGNPAFRGNALRLEPCDGTAGVVAIPDVTVERERGDETTGPDLGYARAEGGANPLGFGDRTGRRPAPVLVVEQNEHEIGAGHEQRSRRIRRRIGPRHRDRCWRESARARGADNRADHAHERTDVRRAQLRKIDDDAVEAARRGEIGDARSGTGETSGVGGEGADYGRMVTIAEPGGDERESTRGPVSGPVRGGAAVEPSRLAGERVERDPAADDDVERKGVGVRGGIAG